MQKTKINSGHKQKDKQAWLSTVLISDYKEKNEDLRKKEEKRKRCWEIWDTYQEPTKYYLALKEFFLVQKR